MRRGFIFARTQSGVSFSVNGIKSRLMMDAAALIEVSDFNVRTLSSTMEGPHSDLM